MNRLTASMLALGLAVTTGSASAQVWFDSDRRYDDRQYNGYSQDARYDYARVIRVRPVVDGGYRSYPASSPRCYQRRDTYADGYGDDRYYEGDRYRREDGYYTRDGYYERDGYYDRGRGSTAGRNVATVLGGLVGAAIGSQVGGGSARYATAAIGTMVGGMAGQRIYEESVRNRQPRTGTVTVCDPVPDDGYYDRYGTRSDGVHAYDVTYEYGGREYTARTNYHPGDRIRVLVDVRPE